VAGPGSASPPQYGDWKCPKCGGKNPAGREKCLGCNTPRNIDPFSLAVIRKDRVALLSILTGEVKEKRIAAAAAIAKLWSDPEVVAALRGGLEDEDPDIRRAFSAAFIGCQFTDREGYQSIVTTLEALTPSAQADFREALDKSYGLNAMDWWRAVGEDFDIWEAGPKTMVSVPTPNWGSGKKVAAAALITAVTGSANAGVGIASQMKLRLNDHIQIPPVCHLCGIVPPVHSDHIQKTVMSSLLGAAIAGSALGDLTLEMDIPLCLNCTVLLRKDIVDIVAYTRDSGAGKVILSLLNPKIAEAYAELNHGFIIQLKKDEPSGWIDVPSGSAAEGGAPGEASLRIFYAGQFFIGDAKVDLILDGNPIGRGTAKTGIDITLPCATGRHSLLLKLLGGLHKKEYSFELPVAGTYEAHLTYDRVAGTFTNKIQMRFKPSQQTDQPVAP
jgi:hypothetical protein